MVFGSVTYFIWWYGKKIILIVHNITMMLILIGSFLFHKRETHWCGSKSMSMRG